MGIGAGPGLCKKALASLLPLGFFVSVVTVSFCHASPELLLVRSLGLKPRRRGNRVRGPVQGGNVTLGCRSAILVSPLSVPCVVVATAEPALPSPACTRCRNAGALEIRDR